MNSVRAWVLGLALTAILPVQAWIGGSGWSGSGGSAPSPVPSIPDAGVTDAATVILAANPADGGTQWVASTTVAPAVNYAARVTPLDSNDVHAWEMTETSGSTFYDTGSSAYPINLTIDGACVAPNFVMGYPCLLGPCPYNNFGSACGVNSVDISAADAGSPGGDLPHGSSPMTLEYWYKTNNNSANAFATGGYQTFTEITGTNGTSVWNVGPYATTSSQWQWYINGGTSAPFTTPACQPGPNPGQWQYIAAVFGGGTYYLYVDGILCASSGTTDVSPGWTTSGASPRTLAIFGSVANSTTTTNMLRGWISRVRLSNIARSQSYIMGVYQKAMLQ